MDNEIAVVENTTASKSVSVIKNAETIKKENNAGLAIMHEVLHDKPNPVIIRGKRHLEFEDWIALGNAYGICVSTGDAEPVEIFDAKGFKAKANVIRISDGLIIGGAEAYCLDNETNWENKDYFQMASMAQTRAGSKALANQLRGVVSLDKSINGTPADEIDNQSNGQVKPVVPKPAAAPKPAAPVSKKKPKISSTITDDTIDVEIVTNESSKTLEELAKENNAINKAVIELKSIPKAKMNAANVIDMLLNFLDLGKITEVEYKEARKLLEE